jgi:hypothetical protein
MFQVIGHNSGDSYEPGRSSNLVVSDLAGLRWPVEGIGPTCPASAKRLHSAEAVVGTRPGLGRSGQRSGFLG